LNQLDAEEVRMTEEAQRQARAERRW